MGRRAIAAMHSIYMKAWARAGHARRAQPKREPKEDDGDEEDDEDEEDEEGARQARRLDVGCTNQQLG